MIKVSFYLDYFEEITYTAKVRKCIELRSEHINAEALFYLCIISKNVLRRCFLKYNSGDHSTDNSMSKKFKSVIMTHFTSLTKSHNEFILVCSAILQIYNE